MNNYSPNMLKTFDECQQKFFFKYVEKLSLPQRASIFEKGKKIHALANYYLKGFDVSKMEKTLNENEKAAWESLKSNKYFNITPVNTEYNLSCKINDNWVGGRLDALMKQEKDFSILDYKTGNIPQNAQEDFQTIVYLLGADKLLNKKGGYESLKFVYLGLKNDENKEIEFSQELKKHYEEKITETCSKINSAVNSNTYTKNPEKCKFCEYSKICNE